MIIYSLTHFVGHELRALYLDSSGSGSDGVADGVTGTGK